MDKNNKKEQTFGDLFSNINKEPSTDNNQIDFNSINKKNTNIDKKDNITLENLFNQSKKVESSKDVDKEQKEEKNNITFSDFNINNDEITSKSDNLTITSKNDTNEEEKINSNEELSTENNIFQNLFDKEIKISENKNDLKKDEENNITKKENTIPKLDTPNIFPDDNLNKNKEKDISTKEENNPFIESFNQTAKVPESINNSIFDNQLSNTNDEIEQDKNNEIIFENNIFINDSTNDSLEQNNLSEIKENETKPEDKNKKDTEIKSEKTKSDEEIISSENPFFTEEKKEEEINPFFDNNLNLVEKPNYNTNNGLTDKIDTTSAKHFNVKIVNKKEPLIKFILGVLSYAIFIWLLLIGITLLIYVADIKIRAAKGDYSSPTFNAYVVLTGSMLPDIQVYDVVVTKKVDAKDLKEGDIITFASSDTRFLNTIITHRIIKKYYDSETKTYTFQTKGDNNNVADSALVQSNNIYGKVILKIPKLGYLQEFLASDGGWIIVILIPCLIVIS